MTMRILCGSGHMLAFFYAHHMFTWQPRGGGGDPPLRSRVSCQVQWQVQSSAISLPVPSLSLSLFLHVLCPLALSLSLSLSLSPPSLSLFLFQKNYWSINHEWCNQLRSLRNVQEIVLNERISPRFSNNRVKRFQLFILVCLQWSCTQCSTMSDKPKRNWIKMHGSISTTEGNESGAFRIASRHFRGMSNTIAKSFEKSTRGLCQYIAYCSL